MQADHRVDLTPDWALWRDFAVRSAGFPVEGLGVFGGEGESERLAEVARNPAFREAVAWQSRESLSRAVDKHATGMQESPSRVRRREDVIASYWQRYCAKNDTIGFFGPLAWGRFAEQGDGFAMRAGSPEHERVVHFENWAVEAVGATAGVAPLVPMDPFPERALRARLQEERPSELASLDRLEAARDAVSATPREGLGAALAELDRVFEEITGREAVRTDGDTGGGRTIAYLDCLRDLNLTLGGEVLDELSTTLPAVLYASRWWCGRVFAAGSELMERIARGRSGPLGPLVGELTGAGWGLFEKMGDEQRELQQRWAGVVAAGDASGLAERAAAAFTDHVPAWRWSAYHSADIQIAAPDADAIWRGEFQLVLGDFHGGDNPLAQGLFAHRHPQNGAVLARIGNEIGPSVHLLPPRRGVVDMTARAYPIYGVEGDVVVTTGEEPPPPGTRAVGIGDVLVDDGHVSDRARSFRVPIAELLFLPIFVAAVRTFDLVGEQEGRTTVGRTVVRRARWSAPAGELPAAADDLGAWARDRGLPRVVFARSPLERKPIYIDFESPALRRVLARFIAPARDAAPDAAVQFAEMLPAPEECWLETEDGHHTSELRLVAVDRTRSLAA
jgi:hypothetical protein